MMLEEQNYLAHLMTVYSHLLLVQLLLGIVDCWEFDAVGQPTETIFSVWNPAQLIPNCAVLGPLESRGSISISQSSRIL